MALSLGQPSVFGLGDNIPFIVLENLPVSLIVFPEPRLLLNEGDENCKDVAFHDDVMNDSDLQFLNAVSDVLQDRDAHYEQTELYFLHLGTQLFLGFFIQNLLYFALLFLLLGEVALLFRLPTFESLLHSLGDLGGNFLIRVIDDVDEEGLALLDCSVVIEHDFQHVAHYGLVVDGEVKLEAVKGVNLMLDHGQHPTFPHCSDQQVDDEQMVLVLH